MESKWGPVAKMYRTLPAPESCLLTEDTAHTQKGTTLSADFRKRKEGVDPRTPSCWGSSERLHLWLEMVSSTYLTEILKVFYKLCSSH